MNINLGKKYGYNADPNNIHHGYYMSYGDIKVFGFKDNESDIGTGTEITSSGTEITSVDQLSGYNFIEISFDCDITRSLRIALNHTKTIEFAVSGIIENTGSDIYQYKYTHTFNSLQEYNSCKGNPLALTVETKTKTKTESTETETETESTETETKIKTETESMVFYTATRFYT